MYTNLFLYPEFLCNSQTCPKMKYHLYISVFSSSKYQVLIEYTIECGVWLVGYSFHLFHNSHWSNVAGLSLFYCYLHKRSSDKLLTNPEVSYQNLVRQVLQILSIFLITLILDIMTHVFHLIMIFFQNMQL